MQSTQVRTAKNDSSSLKECDAGGFLPQKADQGNPKRPDFTGIFARISEIFPYRGLPGWGAWIRTRGWRNQNPLPYHLATPHRQWLDARDHTGATGQVNVGQMPGEFNGNGG
jgi:hypothetical protein